MDLLKIVTELTKDYSDMQSIIDAEKDIIVTFTNGSKKVLVEVRKDTGERNAKVINDYSKFLLDLFHYGYDVREIKYKCLRNYFVW